MGQLDARSAAQIRKWWVETYFVAWYALGGALIGVLVGIAIGVLI